jgi:hypothetical protein
MESMEEADLNLFDPAFDGLANDMERVMQKHTEQIALVARLLDITEPRAEQFLQQLMATGIMLIDEDEEKLIERQAVDRYKMGLDDDGA